MSDVSQNSEIRLLQQEVAKLSAAKKEESRPWYRNIATLISVAAFLVSFGTTVVSYKRTLDQDIHSLRGELVTTLQRLAALPKENIEAADKYKDQPLVYASLSGYLNQENLLLSKQADDAIKKLPADQVSSTDYLAVALALQNSRNFQPALINLKKAADAATMLDEEVAADRYLGGLQMNTGRITEGRASFQRALEVFVKYPGYDDFTKANTNILTELGWAWAEAAARNMDLAATHISNAEGILGSLAKGSGTDTLRSQIFQTRSTLFGTPQANQGPPAMVNAPLAPLAPSGGFGVGAAPPTR